MMAGESATGRLCTLSVKGAVSLFRVKEVASIDSCVLEWKAELSDILKQKNKVYVSQLMVLQ